MDSYVLLGIIGSISSIVSLLLAAPTAKSRIIHAIYGFLLTVVVGSAFIYNQSTQEELNQTKNQLTKITSLRIGAKKLAENYYGTNDIGKNRGFILSSFAFLEKNRSEFPESYLIAKELVKNGLQITHSSGEHGSEGFYDERKRMEDGAETMRALLNGISASPDA
ncbi:hypothetical protein ACL00X_19985 [Aeromonas diversa]|uniref:hypothetical protein n=1 Tax=Aeromonas diversa TaxID=502790 RepID=UPI0039A0669D